MGHIPGNAATVEGLQRKLGPFTFFGVSRSGLRCTTICPMNKAEALDTLRRSEQALRAKGVRHAALFGSVARGDHHPGSDIDILIELDPSANVTVYDYAGLKDFIAGLFEHSVDVVNRTDLKAHIIPVATDDAIDAF